MPTFRTYAKPTDDTVLVRIPKEYASYSFQVILVPCRITHAHSDSVAADIHIFDTLHSDWGGEGSADEIAESIRGTRSIDRSAPTW